MLKFIAATLAVLVGFSAVPAPTAGAAVGSEPTRVLIVGDSVTQGGRGDYTWRYFLSKSLAPGAVDFVGPRRGTFAVHENGLMDWDFRGEGAYANPDFDQDHAAFAGARLARPTGPDDPGLYFHEPINQLAAGYRPEVIVALWGVNDLSYPGQTPTTLIDSYRDWLATARSANPDVDFVIGQLPYTWVRGVAAFNSALTGLAAAESTVESRIVIAEMREPYGLGDSADQVHPNVSGQRKIARMMGAALSTYGLSPVVDPDDVPATQSAVPTGGPGTGLLVPGATAPVATPKPPRRVRAHRKSKRVQVRWRASRGARWYVVRCARVTRRVRGNAVTLRTQSRRCKVQAMNGAGASRWVKVRVRA